MFAVCGPRSGWRQLDSSWARRVVADAGVVPGDLVLDVGAGTGAITRSLAAAGARVVAIERHPQGAPYLSKQFDQRDVPVVRADASDLRLPRRPFRVVSNPPFGITTSLVKRLVSPGSRLIRADLLVPWHAAQRWSSQTLAAEDAGTVTSWSISVGRHLVAAMLNRRSEGGRVTR